MYLKINALGFELLKNISTFAALIKEVFKNILIIV